jgi:hypothetical protein
VCVEPINESTVKVVNIYDNSSKTILLEIIYVSGPCRVLISKEIIIENDCVLPVDDVVELCLYNTFD